MILDSALTRDNSIEIQFSDTSSLVGPSFDREVLVYALKNS